jgi:DNA-binding NtrC family response regulator
VGVRDPKRRNRIEGLLLEAGHDVEVAADRTAVDSALTSRPFDVMILDIGAPEMGGLEVLRALPRLDNGVQVLTVTGVPLVESAVEAMKLGARDLMCCPCDGDYIVLQVERAIEECRIRRELAALRKTPVRGNGLGLVGRSKAFRRLLDLIERVAPTRATALITGETGTGKELVARAIHSLSDRRDHPFTVVNCSALPPTLLESELFGHTRGSFTGAVQSRKGLIEQAHDGTLFLDEIGTIPLEMQVKLLRVIEERRIQRVGSNTPTAVDFRLIAATNEDLGALVREGSFREDLFFRLNVFPVHVPPLRHRKGDIPLLASHFLDLHARGYGLEAPGLSPATVARMMAYPWPGNVRELENVIERAVVMQSTGDALSLEFPDDHDSVATPVMTGAMDGRWTLDRLEREYLLAVLDRHEGEQTAAAADLGVSRRTVHRKLARYRHEGLVPE